MMVFFSRVPRYTHQTLDSRSQSRFSVRLVNIEFPVDVGNEDPTLVTHFVMRGYLRAVLALGSTGSEVCEWRRAPPPGSGHISLERGGRPEREQVLLPVALQIQGVLDHTGGFARDHEVIQSSKWLVFRTLTRSGAVFSFLRVSMS